MNRGSLSQASLKKGVIFLVSTSEFFFNYTEYTSRYEDHREKFLEINCALQITI